LYHWLLTVIQLYLHVVLYNLLLTTCRPWTTSFVVVLSNELIIYDNLSVIDWLSWYFITILWFHIAVVARPDWLTLRARYCPATVQLLHQSLDDLFTFQNNNCKYFLLDCTNQDNMSTVSNRRAIQVTCLLVLDMNWFQFTLTNGLTGPWLPLEQIHFELH